MEQARKEEEKNNKKKNKLGDDYFQRELEQGRFADLLMFGAGGGGSDSREQSATANNKRSSSRAVNQDSRELSSSGYNSTTRFSNDDPDDNGGIYIHQLSLNILNKSNNNNKTISLNNEYMYKCFYSFLARSLRAKCNDFAGILHAQLQ